MKNSEKPKKIFNSYKEFEKEVSSSEIQRLESVRLSLLLDENFDENRYKVQHVIKFIEPETKEVIYEVTHRILTLSKRKNEALATFNSVVEKNEPEQTNGTRYGIVDAIRRSIS